MNEAKAYTPPMIVECICCGVLLDYKWAVWIGSYTPSAGEEYMCQRCADEECDCQEED
jgi:hypothetical protein